MAKYASVNLMTAAAVKLRTERPIHSDYAPSTPLHITEAAKDLICSNLLLGNYDTT